MLVLTRKLKEKLIIGKDIVIEVLGVKGNQVRLGITAPSEIKILREELCTRINENKLSSIHANIKINNSDQKKDMESKYAIY